MARSARSVVLSVLAASAVLFGAPRAVAAPTAERAAGCATTEVAVVVDFGSLGGGTVVRCASGPTSGLDALSRAGFGYGFRPQFPGMVCTIEARPDPCNGAPTDAYWAYWHAPAGGTWAYSTQGAGTRRPAAGSVEGWAFGAERRPSVAPPVSAPTTTATTSRPPSAPAPPAAPTRPTEPSTTTLVPSAAAPSASPTTSASSSSTTTTTGGPAAVSTSATSSTTTTTTTTAGETAAELALEPAASRGQDDRTGLVGLALVVVLLAAGGWEFRRRRTG